MKTASSVPIRTSLIFRVSALHVSIVYIMIMSEYGIERK